MICAYDKVYLNMAQRVMGNMLNYAVYDCGYELSEYYNIFLESGYSERFGKGDVFVIAGMSGAELAIKVLDIPDDKIIMPGVYDGRSREYWTGWILVYYQWYTGKSFRIIQKEVPIGRIRDMYNPYHEMDTSQSVDRIIELSQQTRMETYLKKYRKMAGLTQSQLSEETGIPVKTIQQYEQGRKDIHKAQAEYVIKLAQVLCCSPMDFLEIRK